MKSESEWDKKTTLGKRGELEPNPGQRAKQFQKGKQKK